MIGARKILFGVLIAVALAVAVVSLVAYVEHHLWLGALAVALLGVIGVVGSVSLLAERRRVAALIADLAEKDPTSPLWNARRDRLTMLAKAGRKPDLDRLAEAQRADEAGRAFLGRYFVAVTVLVGLVGTFAGLMEMLRGVTPLLRATDAPGLDVLLQPLVGLDVTFGASVVGILVTLALTLIAGDLTIAEESLRAKLDERTAHDLVPSLWPPASGTEQQILQLLTGWHQTQAEASAKLGAELAAAVGKTFAKEAHGLVTAIETVVGEAHARTLQQLDASVAQIADGTLGRLDAAVTGTLTRLDTTVARTLAELGTAMQTTVKSVDQSSQRTLRDLVTAVESSLGKLEQSTSATAKQLGAAIADANTALAQSTRATADTLVAAIETSHTALDQSTAATVDKLGAAIAHANTELAASTRATAGSLVAAIETSHQTIDRATSATAQKLGATIESANTALVQSTSATAEKLAAAIETSHQTLDRATSATAQKLGAAIETAHAALAKSTSATADKLGATIETSHAALAKATSATTKQLATAIETSHAAIDASTTTRLERLSTAVESSVGTLSEATTASLQTLATTLADTVQRLEQSTTATLQTLRTEVATLTGAQQTLLAAIESERQVGANAAQQSYLDAAAALQPILETFGAAATQLSSDTARLGPELAALAQEIALLAARTETNTSPLVLDEIGRLASSVAALEGVRPEGEQS